MDRRGEEVHYQQGFVTYAVAVEEGFRGEPAASDTIAVWSSFSSCVSSYREGDTYVLYVKEREWTGAPELSHVEDPAVARTFLTDLCSRSLRVPADTAQYSPDQMARVQDELGWLRERREAEEN